MKIKRIGQSDADAIAKLHIEVERQTYEDIVPELLAGVSGLEGRRSIWRTALFDQATRAFGVYVDGRLDPVGFISGRLEYNLNDGGGVAIINSFFVLGEFQYSGNGKALLVIFVRAAIDAGFYKMRGVVPIRNLSARNFFTASGFVEQRLHVIGNERALFQYTEVVCNNLPSLLTYLMEP